MIINEKTTKKISAKLSALEIDVIKVYIQGAVYSFCNYKNEDGKSGWFAVYTLFGKDNYYWKYPLKLLYEYHIAQGKTQKEAVSMAGKDLVILLKNFLIEDDYTYEVDKEQRHFSVNCYRRVQP